MLVTNPNALFFPTYQDSLQPGRVLEYVFFPFCGGEDIFLVLLTLRFLPELGPFSGKLIAPAH